MHASHACAAPTLASCVCITAHRRPAHCRVQSAVLLLRRRLPRTHIVLLGLLPAGRGQYHWPSSFSRALSAVNTQLRCDGQGCNCR